jgi:hypothetical protein
MHPSDSDAVYRAIVNDPKYRHFTHIPGRIIRCLDYFKIGGNRKLIQERLRIYYLFIGVVDNAIDSGHSDVGFQVLDWLDQTDMLVDARGIQSNVGVITRLLKPHIHDESILGKFHDLYRHVLQERSAISIDGYVCRRKAVGSLTAELSYLLICPLLNRDREDLLEFMKRVGSVGCLIDSLIDLTSDHRCGLLTFKPTMRDYAKLTFLTMKPALRLLITYPRLCLLFVDAILDNIQDRFREQQSCARDIVSGGKDKAASVA